MYAYVCMCICVYVCMYVFIIHSYFISHLHLLFGCVLSTLNKDVMMMMMMMMICVRSYKFHWGRNICDTFGNGRHPTDLTENREIYIPQLYSTPRRGRPHRNFAKLFAPGQTRIIGHTLKKVRYVKAFRNATDRQTDRQKELLHQYHASALLCGGVIKTTVGMNFR